MSTTVARIDAILDVDGSRVPRQVKQLGNRIGKEAGDAVGDEFNDTLDKHLSDWGNHRLDIMRDRFKRMGRDSGRIFGLTLRQASENEINSWLDGIVGDIAKVFTFDGGEGWDQWVQKIGDVDLAYRRMAEAIDVAHNEGRIQADTVDHLNDELAEHYARTKRAENAHRLLAMQLEATERHMGNIERKLASSNQFRRHINEVGDLDTAYRGLWKRIGEIEQVSGDQRWADRMRIKLIDYAESADKASQSTSKLDHEYRNLPHGLRQAIFWVTLVTAALPDLAVLSSAAGAGLLVLANGLFALVAGGGVAFAAFKDLGEDLKDLPESSHAAKIAFDEMTDAFGRLQDRISERVLGQVAPAFERITGLVDRLAPSFDVLADAVALATDELSKIFASEKGFAAFKGAFEAAAPIFTSLAKSAGKLVVALLQAFGNKEVQRSTQELIGWIDLLIDRFDAFTQNGGLDEWMQNARTIFGELGELLDVTGRLLNDLVNPETVANTADFIDSLSGIMPFLESILNLVAEANPFGLLAQGLETLGTVLTPILDALAPFLDAVSTVLGLFMEVTEVFWSFLYPIFLPLELAWEAVSLAIERFMIWAEPIITALQDMGDEIKALGDDIWEDLEPALSDLFDAFLDLLPEPEELARIIREDVIPQIKGFADWINNKAIPAIEGFIGFIEDVITALGGWDGIKSKLSIIGAAFTGFGTVVSVALAPIKWFIDQIITGINWILQNLPKAQSAGASVPNPRGNSVPQAAAGRMVNQSTFLEAGEAGREMIVPLDRPLSQVNPDVRDVAAYAQGKGGRGAVIEAGAIVVTGVSDPYRASYEMLYQLTERLG